MNVSESIASFLVVCIGLGVSITNGEKMSVLPNPKVEVSEEVAYEKLKRLEGDASSMIESAVKWSLSAGLRLSSEVELSPECQATLFQTLIALKDMKLWAFQMLDASAKPGAGYFSGTTNQWGSYHQCLRVVIPGGHRDENGPEDGTGQYCVIALRPPLPPMPEKMRIPDTVFRTVNATFKTEVMQLLSDNIFVMYVGAMKFGLCFPSNCHQSDISRMIEYGANQFGISAEVESCELPAAFSMTTLQIIVAIILSSVVLLCLIATVMSKVRDHCHEAPEDDEKTYGERILKSFSILENFTLLMRTRAVNKPLDSLDGIKYLSASWVVLAHVYFLLNKFQQRELLNMWFMGKDFFYSPIHMSFLSLDSFFLVSGVLISYNAVRTFDSHRTYNPIVQVLRRMWRFIPTVLVLMGVMILLPSLTSGPNYKEMMNDFAQNCKNFWWTNIIFISNFLPPTDMCVPHLWYLSADMQLLLCSIPYFLLLFRNPSYGKSYLAVAITMSSVSSGLVTYFMDFPPTIYVYTPKIKKMFELIRTSHIQPNGHLGVYSVGLFLGTYLARNPKSSLSRTKALLGWLVAVSLGITMVYAVYPWVNGTDYSTLEAVAFSSTQKLIWGMCVAWVILTCFIGKGGFVNNVLSWPGFHPLVKLSYGIYLVHAPVILVYNYSRLGNHDMSHAVLVFTFFGAFCISHIFAVLLKLFVEAPCSELDQIFRSWLNERKRNSAEECPKDDDFTPKGPLTQELQTSNQNGEFKVHL